MSQVNTNAIYDASGGQSAKLYGPSMRYGGTAFVNRIINGDMRIDQRNAGASVSKPSSQYVLDRWNCNVPTPGAATVSRSTVAPPGFSNSLLVNVTTGGPIGTGINYIQQAIEGFNAADFGFGAANAASVTLSFWARSSVTGTFGGSFRNGAANRSYAFTYSISAANTWEQKTVTVAGDTTGTWATDNSAGLSVFFDLGSGAVTGTAGSWAAANYIGATGTQTGLMTTNGGTFYITGVQLEAGSVASPFERRDYGRELMMCQRYYQVRTGMTIQTYSSTSFYAVQDIGFSVVMRAAPTVTLTNGTTNNLASSSTTTPSASGFGFALGPLSTGMCAVGSGQNAGYTASAEL